VVRGRAEMGVLGGGGEVGRYGVEGDAIPFPLAPAGDAIRGRALIVARESANCVLCHVLPDPALTHAGDLGPALNGIGGRLTVPQLRLRGVDMRRVEARTLMPSYYRTHGLTAGPPPYTGPANPHTPTTGGVRPFLST